jgi:trehalose-6-phosphate synthase
MEAAVNSAAGRINGTYSEANWAPVRYVNRPTAAQPCPAFTRQPGWVW